MKKGILALVVIVLSYAILSVGMNLVGTTGETFTGAAQGFGGEVSVSVLMDGDKIISVAATGASETQGIGSNAIDQLPAKIVEANSTDVDVVAGASVTSKAIIAAVNSALGIETAVEEPAKEDTTEIPEGALTGTAKGFGGDVTVYIVMDGDKIASVQAKGPDETQGIGSNAIDQLPAKIVEANSADVDVVAGATYTSKAIIEAVKTALASNSASEEPAAEAPEGALTGKAEGFGGDVTVTVVMDGDKIASVDVKGPDETQGIGSNAIDQLPAKIVEANSTDVDVIAGATYTSKAIIEAVNNALK
ncbi:MAG: FMN-binding protein [Sedimentibacter sp.]